MQYPHPAGISPTGISGGFLRMIRILFVCHGNICRSPMAEFVMKRLAEEADIPAETLILIPGRRAGA